ncbi:hypothetical protein FRB90_008039 [Tulasnella sp. 427]|nr:hypothetical protein FRB90_008039 [Tulasnella sp. 427]
MRQQGQVDEEDLPEDTPLAAVGGPGAAPSQSQKLKKKMGAMNVALKRVNIDERQLEESSEEEDEEEESGSSEEKSSEEEEEEEVKPKLQFHPDFVSKRNRVTVVEREEEDPNTEEAIAKREQAAEQKTKDSHNLVAESIRRELAEKEAEDLIPDVDDTDGLEAEAEFEAWRLRELGRIKRDKEAQRAKELEKEEVERRRAMPEEQRMNEDLEHAKKLRDDKPKGQQKFLQKYYHKGAFHQDAEILKRHDYTEATVSTLDVTLLPKVMQVKDFGKRGRTKYTHLLDQDTTRVGEDGKGGGAICFICGGPHLKKDCPSNPLNGGDGGPGATASPVPRLRSLGSGVDRLRMRAGGTIEVVVDPGETATAMTEDHHLEWMTGGTQGEEVPTSSSDRHLVKELIVDALTSRPAVIVCDNSRNTFWVRVEDEKKGELKLRLNSLNSGSFVCREAGGDPSDLAEAGRLEIALLGDQISDTSSRSAGVDSEFSQPSRKKLRLGSESAASSTPEPHFDTISNL